MFTSYSKRMLQYKFTSILERLPFQRLISTIPPHLTHAAAEPVEKQSEGSAIFKRRARLISFRKINRRSTRAAGEPSLRKFVVSSRLAPLIRKHGHGSYVGPRVSDRLRAASQYSPERTTGNARTVALINDSLNKDEEPKRLIIRRYPIPSITPPRNVNGVDIARSREDWRARGEEGDELTGGSPHSALRGASKTLLIAQRRREHTLKIAKFQASPTYPDPKLERLDEPRPRERKPLSQAKIRKAEIRSPVYRQILRSPRLIRRSYFAKGCNDSKTVSIDIEDASRSPEERTVRRSKTPPHGGRKSDNTPLPSLHEKLQRREALWAKYSVDAPTATPLVLRETLRYGSKTLRGILRRRLRSSMKVRQVGVLAIRKRDERQIGDRRSIRQRFRERAASPSRVRRLRTTVKPRRYMTVHDISQEMNLIRKYHARITYTEDGTDAAEATPDPLRGLDTIIETFKGQNPIESRSRAMDLHTRAKR